MRSPRSTSPESNGTLNNSDNFSLILSLKWQPNAQSTTKIVFLFQRAHQPLTIYKAVDQSDQKT